MSSLPTTGRRSRSIISTSAMDHLDLPGELGWGNSMPSTRNPMEWYFWRQSLMTGISLFLSDICALFLAAALASFAVVFCFLDASITLICSESVAAFSVQAIMGLILGSYPGIFLNPIQELQKQCSKVMISWLIVCVMASVFGIMHLYELIAIGVAFTLNLALAPICRSLTRSWCLKIPSWGQNALVVGANPRGSSAYHFLRETPELGLRPIGIVGDPNEFEIHCQDILDTYQGELSELDRLATEHKVSWIIATTTNLDDAELQELVHHCAKIPNIVLLPGKTMLPSLWTQSRECGGMSGMYLQDQLLFPFPRIFKRCFDLVTSILGLILLLPFFLITCAIIKLTSDGPCFFGHERIGRHGHRFRAWKFRTMVPNADQVLQDYLQMHPELQEEWDRDQKLRSDPRIIPFIGQFLRKSSLDELPQLWNVMMGEMSLVGPRPIVQSEVEKYASAFPLYMLVTPGITGLWQISGRNNTTYRERVQFDVYYVRNWSIWMDFYILSRTFRTVILREGAY